MKRFNNLKVFGLFIVLICVVAFISLNFLKAEKAKPEESWKKEISKCGKCNTSRPSSAEALSPSNTHYWAKTYGCGKNGNLEDWEPHPQSISMEQTRDGGYILADGIYPADNTEEYLDIWVVKLSSDGAIDWHRCYGGDLLEGWPAIKTTDDGGYIVMNSVYSPGYDQGDFWIFKLDSIGNIEWQKIYGGPEDDAVTSIHPTQDGGYIVTGDTESFGSGGIFVLKLGLKGDIEWQHVYEGGIFPNILPTSDGGFLITNSINLNEDWDVWVLKLGANGYSEWQRTYGGPESDVGRFAIEETSGGYIVNCHTDSFCATQAIWILKLTKEGDIKWQRTYDGYSTDWASSFQQTGDGGYIFGGGTVSFGAGLADILLLKLNPTGSVEWQRTYGENNGELLYSVHQDDDGSYVLGGWSESRSYRLLMMKIPQNGDIEAFCGITDFSNMTCSKTDITPQEINITPIQSNIVSRVTNVQTEELNACEEVICWNLNQAPENISLRREVNRSLFTKEVFHTISWTPNPSNDQFDITEYRIYRSKLYHVTYEQLAVVPGNSYEYVDGYLDMDAGFNYVVTSVDSEGHESPKSHYVTGGPSGVN